MCFITYTKKICKIVLNFFIMCAKKSCHLVPKYIPLNEDRKNHQNPASYCLSTTCGTSHEGYTIHTDSCQNNTRPNILFFVLMQGTFYHQHMKNKKGSFLQSN